MRFLIVAVVFCLATPLAAQHPASWGAAVGVSTRPDAQATAAFSLSAGFQWHVPWLVMLQHSVADTEARDGGTLRATSLLLAPSCEFGFGIVAAGVSLFRLGEDRIDQPDESKTAVAPSALAGFQFPLAGRGLTLELLARLDYLEGRDAHTTGLIGLRFRPGAPRVLTVGEPVREPLNTRNASIWNDVLMQLILLEQGLESFTRIREIAGGIELEFDQRSITLYDDVAKTARVLAAAQPPVTITVMAPNPGRVAAAATAGSFPPERLRLQRDSRVVLRVEH